MAKCGHDICPDDNCGWKHLFSSERRDNCRRVQRCFEESCSSLKALGPSGFLLDDAYWTPDFEGRAEGETAGGGAKRRGMTPLLFLNPRWVRENPVAAVLVGVIFIGLSSALVDW